MIAKYLRYLSSTATIPKLQLAYPYQYTLNPQQCQYLDPRFTQFQATQQLSPQQKQHLSYTLTGLQQLLNSTKLSSPTVTQYIDSTLLTYINDYKNMIKQQQSNTVFEIDVNGCQEVRGYLEIYGMKEGKYIHEYEIERKDDRIVMVGRKKVGEKMDGLEQLEKDIKEIEKEGSMGQKFKQQLLKKSKNKKRGVQFIFKIGDMFKKSHQNYKQSKKFQPYHLINSISTTMSVQINNLQNKSQAKPNKIENINLVTKWYYEVTSQQPQSVRKSRKRVLFDIQLWRRGCMIPVKNFVQN